MKKNKTIGIVAFLFVTTILISSCSTNDGELDVIGEWTVSKATSEFVEGWGDYSGSLFYPTTGGTWIFREDGTCSITDLPDDCRYDIEGNQLRIIANKTYTLYNVELKIEKSSKKSMTLSGESRVFYDQGLGNLGNQGNCTYNHKIVLKRK